MVFRNVYDGFDLLLVGADGHCELSYEWQQQQTVCFEFCFTWFQDWMKKEL